MPTQDNQLAILSSGAADWDADLDANFAVIERGYHISEHAGQAISSGQVLALNSGGFFKPYDPTVTSMPPVAYAFTAAASGDSMQALAWGIVRSLDVNSLGAPGKVAYATLSGYLTTVASGFPVGIFTTGRGILFNPDHGSGAGGTPGVTKVLSLSDVDPAGLADGSILKWSNASSKFTMQVDSAGGGGTTAMPLTDVFTTTHANGPGWDPSFVSSVTLANSNRNATPLSSSPYNHMMAQPARYSGKRYFEFLLGATTTTAIGITGSAGHNGFNDNGVGVFGNMMGQMGWAPDGSVTYKLSTVQKIRASSQGNYANSTYLGIAVDLDNRLMWTRVNTAGVWVGVTTGTSDPSSGTNGIPITGAFNGAGNILIWPGASDATAMMQLFLSSADIGARIPPGFKAWSDT